MRILVHDHSGHPFQVELSRALAAGGHQVLHLHCATFSTPKADLARRPGDPEGFEADALSHDRPFDKYSYIRRLGQERQYGRRLISRAQDFSPDALLVCNTPLLTQLAITRWGAREQVRTVLWLQDLYSEAARHGLRGLRQRVGLPLAVTMERAAVRRSDHVVAISETFRGMLERWGAADRVSVIPNWAPLAEVTPRPKDNPWARRHGLDRQFVVMYTGTLGLKHDPELLVELARHLAPDSTVRVVVVSEGPGADHLRSVLAREPRLPLVVLDYARHDVYPDALGAADVLIAILGTEPGQYSVPSKILTYHCAGRPILGVLPEENPAAATIRAAGSGAVVPVDDRDAIGRALDELRADPSTARAMGARAREYAEKHFAIGPIADRFERLIQVDPQR